MTTTGKPPESAAVIGGGVVGLACALHLRSRGIATVVIDSRPSHSPASWGNAGHIATEQVEPLASMRTIIGAPRRLFSRGGALALPARDVSAWFPFACRLLRAAHPQRFEAGTQAMKSLLASAVPAWRRLVAMTDDPQLLVEDGHFIVWESPDSARRGREFWTNADTGDARVSEATREEIARITGLVARAPAGALRFTGTARVRDPGDALGALERAFRAGGGEILVATVERLRTDGGRASLELADGRCLHRQVVVVAAGVGSRHLMRPLGHRVPIIAERGYHLHGAAPDWPDLPPVVFEDRSLIVSRFRSGLRAASFVEFSRADSPPDPRKWQRLRRHVLDLHLPFAEAPREWMGSRPTLPDYLPAIGRSAVATNLLYAFGHQHLGLTLAPITGEIVADLAVGEAPAVPLAPFRLERF